jgi:hypothetical protein
VEGVLIPLRRRVVEGSAMADPNSTFPDLIFKYAADKDKYVKAFCVSPADDHCNFKICPNQDVTGIGQQISSEQLYLYLRFNSFDKPEKSLYHDLHLRYDT